MKTVTLYTKLGCHLCEAVEATIAAVAVRRQFAFIRRDIAEDVADYELYQYDIPVVHVNGKEVARHRMTVRQLLEALNAVDVGDGHSDGHTVDND